MIARLSGILLEKTPVSVVIDVAGVAYDVAISMQTFCQLPEIQQKLILHIHMLVREDALLLFGFASLSERRAFVQLLKVSGIGAKTALGILSVLNENELAHALAHEDITRLSSVPGIGKKTAERMVLELRGKFQPVPEVSGSLKQNPDIIQDIINTLLAQGYKEREALIAVKKLPENIQMEEGIKWALKSLSS